MKTELSGIGIQISGVVGVVHEALNPIAITDRELTCLENSELKQVCISWKLIDVVFLWLFAHLPLKYSEMSSRR